jgi:hypothetical protein
MRSEQWIMLAQGPQVPWAKTEHWLFGLIGFMGIIALVSVIAVNARKMFGKHPPIHEELTLIRHEFKESDQQLERAICQERKDREEQMADLQRDRQRSVEKIHKKMNGISRNVYLIAGKLGVKPLASSDEEED